MVGHAACHREVVRAVMISQRQQAVKTEAADSRDGLGGCRRRDNGDDRATLAAAERKTDAASVIDALLEARVQLRAEKAWKLSDLIRDRLAAVGVQVEDSAGGSSWRWV